MRLVSDLKGIGYLTSTASVALLGAVSWKSAARDPLMLACLLAGMLLSVAGMLLRWRSHRLDQAEKDERSERRKLGREEQGFGPIQTAHRSADIYHRDSR